jgi:uncharacterized protein YebE (UPF0316 family)
LEWWIAVSLILSNVLDDAVATFITLFTLRKRKWLAAGLTVCLNYLVSWSIRNYAANNYLYIHPVAWGSGLGTLLAIQLDSWYRKRERLKNLEKARIAKKLKQSPPVV